MYIPKKFATIIIRGSLSVLSLWLLWYLFSQFGLLAFRLFPTWVLLISMLYFFVSAAVLLLSTKPFNGKIICPMLEGMIIVNLLFMSLISLASAIYHFYLPMLPDWVVWFITIIMPIVAVLDWAIFIKKGAWRPISPLYWLALPVCYGATMIFVTQILPDDATLRFPLEIFNYTEYGLLPACGWAFVIVLFILIIGYIFYCIDFTLSGQLAQKVVLPHLQVVEVDEHGNVIAESQPLKPQAATTAPKSTASPKSANSSRPNTSSKAATSSKSTRKPKSTKK